jgi:hypothetical protein
VLVYDAAHPNGVVRTHASLWSGSAGTWEDLDPAGGGESYAYGVSGDQQVGVVDGHAALWKWSETTVSWVDLNPTEGGESVAYGVSGDQQVGFANGHAILWKWSGTTVSCVDLSPAGSTSSCARGVSDGQQVGYASTYTGTHAGLWSGTKETWVDLHPAGAGYTSSAYGVSDGQQVGFAQIGSNKHASLWSGSADSWVDLNPEGASSSFATGVSAGLQVGYACFNEMYVVQRAILWSGTAEDWLDLHALLPADFQPTGAPGGQSQATSIDVSADGETWVAGWAYNSSENRNEAILWHYTPVPAPIPTLVEQIQEILEFTEKVAGATLRGVGPGKSADNRLRALVNMLEFAGYAIFSEDYDIACDQLTAALAKCDGQSPPPDFVEGDARGDLATMIQELITELYEML